MVTASKEALQPPPPTRRVLIVGNYCHDVLIQNGTVVGESIGGASSFLYNVLNGLSIPCNLVSKVGQDFKYEIEHTPIVVPDSRTTAFHAYFYDKGMQGDGQGDRVLKRVCACDPIGRTDLPDTRFDFGMAVGVGGEISPETLESMIEMCDFVLVDIQALIRDFDDADGTVKLVKLHETGFYHLLPGVGVLKASAEEAVFMDLEEVRKWCYVVVTNGKDGCKVYWKDGELEISPFLANQEDPTGAGDSYLGGYVAGLVQGLAVPDAALLGNFFGSITVEQVGLPKFDSGLLQRVKDEVHRRKMQCPCSERSHNQLEILKSAGHEQFHASLSAVKLEQPPLLTIQESKQDRPSSPAAVEQEGILPCFSRQGKLLVNSVGDEPIHTVEGNALQG
uniref:Carbohydrate kinase PfkB domain-containing protein n=1 Tax=Rhizophora mucronata TaxID=61149 RepID=A0A2P2N3Z4_RHIMU